jgi:hypothetical protein
MHDINALFQTIDSNAELNGVRVVDRTPNAVRLYKFTYACMSIETGVTSLRPS